MGQAPDYEIVGGNMQITLDEFVIAMPVNVFLVGCAKGRAAIIKWEAHRPAGEIIRFPGKDDAA